MMKNNRKRFWALLVVAVMIACGASTLMSDHSLQASSKKNSGGSSANKETVTELVLPSKDCSVKVKATLPEKLEIGDTVTLKASLKGFDKVDYSIQWQYGKEKDGKVEWKDVSGATGKSMDVTLTSKNSKYQWRAVVKAGGDKYRSSAYTIKGVKEESSAKSSDSRKVTIDAVLPENLQLGDTITLKASLSGFGTESYTLQWQKGKPNDQNKIEWKDMNGENGKKLKVEVTEKHAGYRYRVVAKVAGSTVKSSSYKMSAALAAIQTAAAPIETEAPVIVEIPVITEAPAVTEAPVAEDIKSKQSLVQEPIVAEEPVATEEPVVTEEPEVTEEPVVAEEPVATEEPVVAEEPVVTEEPVVAEEPIVAEEPVATEEPVVAEEPVATEEPVVAEEPVATEEPVMTEEPVVEELSIEEQLDPNRSIDVRVDSWDGEIGHKATLRAVLHGYDNAVYTITWKTSTDNVNWQYLDGEHGETMSFVVTKDNCTNYWNVEVTVTGIR